MVELLLLLLLLGLLFEASAIGLQLYQLLVIVLGGIFVLLVLLDHDLLSLYLVFLLYLLVGVDQLLPEVVTHDAVDGQGC